MKVGLCTIAFSELPLEKVLDIAAEYGFDGVEVWGKAPHIPDEYDEKYVKAIPGTAQDRGLEIISFGSYVNPLMEDYEKHWNMAFRIASDLGTKVMRVWSGGGSSKDTTPENKAAIISRFRAMSKKAEQQGIILATEMHGGHFTDTAETILELISAVGHPNFRTYYQPRLGQDAADPYEAARMIGEYVVNVHAQNVKLSDDGKMSSCQIADGVVDYGRVVQILKSKGFDGCLEVEFVYGEDKMAALKQDRDFLAKLAGREE
jgi:sugar phosphate isomerase/epimerase